MERPLDIAFHNCTPSTAIEAEIREQMERLETRYGHLTGCRVSVEKQHQKHQTGNLFEVHVTLSVPGRDLAVSRAPHHARDKNAHPDARSAVRDAFRAAERQLQAWKGKQREDTSGPNGSALAGEVALVQPGEDHGFILTGDGTQLYFHRDSVTNGKFEDLAPGRSVHYVLEESGAGPVAAKIRIALPDD